MKILLFIFAFLSFGLNSISQTNMYIRKIDGSIVSFAVTDIDSIFYINTVASPVTDFDGNTYQTVQIGTQTWMAENLKVTHYADGTAIPFISDDATWGALGDNDTDKAYSYYNNDASGEANIYGALYSFAAAMNGSTIESSQGVCPTGWHMPSSAEWTTMTDFVGGEAVAGGKLRESGTTHWTSPNDGATNETYFTGLGSGYRHYTSGTSTGVKSTAYFWTSTEASATNGMTLKLTYTSIASSQSSLLKSLGAAVRCVKN